MEVRIYYEDTDAGEVVYHANYLRYLERGRTEYLRGHGLSVQQMHDEGIIFPVASMEINYRYSARLDDLLEVETEIVEVKNSYFVAGQRVIRKKDGKLLVDAKVKLACVGEGMKPRRLPKELKEFLAAQVG